MAIDLAAFTITETPSKVSSSNPSPATFTWDDVTHTAPQGGWETPLKLRTNRTDYVGTDIPTEQVLGSNFEPTTLEGIWDNRYNGGSASDFARSTYESFKAMFRRGNPVIIEWDHVQMTGIITDFIPTHYTNWRIGYKFTVSPHYESPGGDVRKTQAAPKPADPPVQRNARLLNHLIDLQASYDSLPHNELAAASNVIGIITNVVLTAINALDTTTQQLDTLTASRTFSLDTTSAALDSFKNINATTVSKIANLFQHVASDANTILTATSSLIATSVLAPDAYGTPTNTLAYDDALNFMAFDLGIKDMRITARQMITESQGASADLLALVSPDAQALYQTHSGETLYEISNMFYQTPTRWVEIYNRNKLVSPLMTGAELLVIPINGVGA